MRVCVCFFDLASLLFNLLESERARIRHHDRFGSYRQITPWLRQYKNNKYERFFFLSLRWLPICTSLCMFDYSLFHFPMLSAFGAYVCFHFAFRTLILFTLVLLPLQLARLRTAIDVVCKEAPIQIAYLSFSMWCQRRNKSSLIRVVVVKPHNIYFFSSLLPCRRKNTGTQNTISIQIEFGSCAGTDQLSHCSFHITTHFKCVENQMKLLYLSRIYSIFVRYAVACCEATTHKKKIDGKSRRYHHIFSTQSQRRFFPSKFPTESSVFFSLSLFTWDFAGSFPFYESKRTYSFMSISVDKLCESTWIKTDILGIFFLFIFMSFDGDADNHLHALVMGALFSFPPISTFNMFVCCVQSFSLFHLVTWMLIACANRLSITFKMELIEKVRRK